MATTPKSTGSSPRAATTPARNPTVLVIRFPAISQAAPRATSCETPRFPSGASEFIRCSPWGQSTHASTSRLNPGGGKGILAEGIREACPSNLAMEPDNINGAVHRPLRVLAQVDEQDEHSPWVHVRE